MSERTTFAVAVLVLVLIAVGLLAADQVNLLPALAATRATEVDRLFRMLVGIATVIFLIVEGGLVYAVLRFRRRKGDLADLLPHVGQEFSRAGPTAIIGIPANGRQTALVEPVKNAAHPGGRTAAALGNLLVGQAAARQQNDIGVLAIDSVDQLLFHTVELLPFIRLESPCSDSIHCIFSTTRPAASTAVVENFVHYI